MLNVQKNYVVHMCSVCKKGVGNNTIFMQSCQRRVQMRCSGEMESLYKARPSFICNCCNISTLDADKDNSNEMDIRPMPEKVDKFRYCGNESRTKSHQEKGLRTKGHSEKSHQSIYKPNYMFISWTTIELI